MSQGDISLWFPTRSDTNQAVQTVQSKRMARLSRGLRFWMQEVERLSYHICSENKGADQLGFHVAELRLCWNRIICAKSRYSHDLAHIQILFYMYKQTFQLKFSLFHFHPSSFFGLASARIFLLFKMLNKRTY